MARTTQLKKRDKCLDYEKRIKKKSEKGKLQRGF